VKYLIFVVYNTDKLNLTDETHILKGCEDLHAVRGDTVAINLSQEVRILRNITFDAEHPRWRVYARYIRISIPHRRNQSRPTLFFALLKIIERPGFDLYSHHEAL
jgi:hypothetical protein